MMSIILLTKELDSCSSAAKFMRSSLTMYRRKHHISYSNFTSTSSTFSHSTQLRYKQGIDYRSKLMECWSNNERLHRGVNALIRDRRRHWRATAAILDIVIGYLDDADQISADDADILFRCCGRLTPAASNERRLEYLRILWNRLPRLGLSHDLNAYTRLQQMLLQNQKKFTASAFLDRVRASGLQPNCFLYLGSIIRCSMDDQPKMDEINSYVDLVKHVPCDKYTWTKVRSAVVSAQVRAGNETKARLVIDEVTANGNSEEGRIYLNQAYFSVAAVSAQRGNTSALFKAIDQARNSNVPFSDFQLLYFARWLAHAGRQDAVLRVLNYMPKRFDWIYRTLPFVLSLIADGHNVTALTVLQRSAASAAEVACQPTLTIPDQSAPSDESLELLPNMENVYRFLLDLFYLKLPIGQIKVFCRRLADCGYTEDAFQLASVAAFDMKQLDMGKVLLEEAQSRSVPFSTQQPSKPDDLALPPRRSPLQPSHFWNALRIRSSLVDVDGVVALLKQMESELLYPGVATMGTNILGQLYSPKLDIETIIAVFGTYASRTSLLTAMICVYLREGDREKALECVNHFPRTLVACYSTGFTASLCDYYRKTYDMDLVVQILARFDKRAKEIGFQSDVPRCIDAIYRRLRRYISSSDLAGFKDCLSKAGFTLERSNAPVTKSDDTRSLGTDFSTPQ